MLTNSQSPCNGAASETCVFCDSTFCEANIFLARCDAAEGRADKKTPSSKFCWGTFFTNKQNQKAMTYLALKLVPVSTRMERLDGLEDAIRDVRARKRTKYTATEAGETQQDEQDIKDEAEEIEERDDGGSGGEEEAGEMHSGDEDGCYQRDIAEKCARDKDMRKIVLAFLRRYEIFDEEMVQHHSSVVEKSERGPKSTSKETEEQHFDAAKRELQELKEDQQESMWGNLWERKYKSNE